MKRRLSIIVIAATLAGLVTIPALWPGTAFSQGNSSTTQQDPAVQAYIQRQKAEDSAARDMRVAAKLDALTNNPGSPVIGNAQGDVTIVEFFDYTCPYCKAAEPRLRALVKADKHIKLVMKEFPILAPVSLPAARMALAAAKQGKYERFHVALMSATERLDIARVEQIAKSVGLDVARLHKDMYDPDVTDEIIANFNLARAIRAFQTPTYIIGGHVLTQDSADIDFAQEVSAARKSKK